ncbi:MAG: hypothetical protein EOP04_18255 [Proteobacteria bacterium]|nr:MAG: hypothetical protein EOP04_18255 [Pseudomonadota bacterium]
MAGSAWFNRRSDRKGNPIQVWYWSNESNKQVPLSRKLYRHLDSEQDDVVQTWVDQWAALNGVYKSRPDLVPPPAAWVQVVERFARTIRVRKNQKLADNTIKEHVRHVNVALGHFIKCGCESFLDFKKHSRDLHAYLLELGKTERRIFAINQSMQVFWQFLIAEDLAEGALKLAGGVKENQPTPLQQTYTPDQILNISFERDDIKLMALIGYFFSLRPQEIFALRPCDFKAGSTATTLECCKVFEKVGLYNRFAVLVNKQKTMANKISPPKKHSIGHVACFDERAAKQIVRLLKDMPLDQPIFKFGGFWLIELWSKHGIKGTVLKDMRRASSYYLGHYTELSLVSLKNHCRHKSVETTTLYTRRPEENPEIEMSVLDLDA